MEALLAMMKAQMEQQTRSQAAKIKMLHTLTTKAPPPRMSGSGNSRCVSKKTQKSHSFAASFTKYC
jgi:4-diphosphocytidyl-2C-methyl-D-erythritol kinase